METVLIRDTSEATPDWVTAVLRSTGQLSPHETVTGVEVVDIGTGIGMLGRVYRLALTFEEANAPATVVLKLPASDPGNRAVASMFRFYPREVGYYQGRIRPGLLDSPQCHLAVMDPDTEDFTILMEDVGHLRSVDQIVGIAPEDASAALAHAARLHAHYWHSDSLAGLADVYLPIQNDQYPITLPPTFDGGWIIARELLADLLSDDVVAVGDRWSRNVPWLLGNLPMHTLIHGDLRADNLFFADGGNPRIVDFQVIGQSTPAFDAAYLFSQSLDPDVRRRHEKELARNHLAELTRLGVEGYSFEQYWDEYRVSLLFCLVYPMSFFLNFDLSDPRSVELARVMIERGARAIDETKAYELLPD